MIIRRGTATRAKITPRYLCLCVSHLLNYKQMKYFSILIVIFSLIQSSFSQERVPDARGFLVKVGDTARDFTMTLADDGSVIKLSDLRGEVVMLQFTASWCGVCRKEMPHIEKEIWQAYKDKGLHVYAVDRDEPKAKALMLKEQTGITYPIGLDPGADIFGLYAGKKEGVTRNVLIDRNGKIIFLTRLYNVEEFSKLVERIDKEVNGK